MQTSLLIHFDGPVGSTTIVDATGTNTINNVSGATLDSAWSAFGNSSGLFDGHPGGLSLTDNNGSLDLGFGDCTIDLVVRWPDTVRAVNEHLLSNNTAGTIFAIGKNINGNIYWAVQNFGAIVSSSFTVVPNTAYQVEVCRKDRTWYLFINGVLQGSSSLDSAQSYGGVDWSIANGGFEPICWIDEVRVVKGFAEHTASFSPPSGPYSVDAYEPRTPLYIDIRGYQHHIQLRSWFGRVPPAVVVAPFSQTDWPLPRDYTRPVTLRTVTASFNKNLIGQDALPVGEIRAELTVKPYEYAIQLHNWRQTYNPNLVGKDRLPTGKNIYDLTPRGYIYPLDVRTITETFNPSLIGQDKFPAGKIENVLARGYEHHIQFRTWTWQYNQNLVGQDFLPVGKDIFELPPQPPLSSIQLRSWITFVNLALSTPPQPKPFAQFDWPLNFGPLQPIKTFTASYNLDLIGQDKLPTGVEVTDLPPRPYEYANFFRSWVVNLQQGTLQPIPYGEIVYDRPPLGPIQPIRSWTWNYNINLIGQDQLPVGRDVIELPPQPALSSIQLRTWLQTVNLALTVQAAQLPLNQFDWPVPKGPQQPTQIFTAFYNRNLIGKDRLPFRQQDWPLPTQPPRPLSLVTWIDRAKSYLQTPHHQLDWPVPRAHLQPIQTFTASYNRNLIGRDRLPFRQQDWPLPRDARRLSDWIAPTNLKLLPPTPPTALPFNQFDWPLPIPPIAKFRQRYAITYYGNSLLPIFTNPIPPPPPPTPPTDEPYRFTPGLEWQHFDRIREPGPIGWR